MAKLNNTSVDDSGFIRLPVGASNQRPGDAQPGMIRWNSEDQRAEVYNGNNWVPLFDLPD